MHKVQQDQLELQAHKAQRAHKVIQELQVQLDQQDHKAQRDHKAKQEQQV